MLLKNNQSGATILEFSISALVLFTVCSVLFDFGLGLRNYALLTEAVSASARNSGVYRGQAGGRTCDELETETAQAAVTYLRQDLGISGDYRFQARTTRSPTGAIGMNLQGEWPLSCVFCMFFPRGLSVHSSAQVIFEDPDQACSI